MPNLVLATVAFAVTFWAWNLIGPLAGSLGTVTGLVGSPEGWAGISRRS